MTSEQHRRRKRAQATSYFDFVNETSSSDFDPLTDEPSTEEDGLPQAQQVNLMLAFVTKFVLNVILFF